jgi:hypothetical protein
VDIRTASESVLLGLATKAFKMGLQDGAERRWPRSSDSAMLSLMGAGDRWPAVFQRRMRAVYLAGFQLIKAIQEQPPSEFPCALGKGDAPPKPADADEIPVRSHAAQDGLR